MANKSLSEPDRQRAHVERMLQRAVSQQKRAEKLVEKWRRRIDDLDRAGVAALQPSLWAEDPEPKPEPPPAENTGAPAMV